MTTKIAQFSVIYYHAKFSCIILYGTTIIPNSEVRRFAMLVLLMVGN